MNSWIRVLPLASLLPLAAAAQAPQAPQSVPNGLPSWAYNIPDKVQPPEAAVPRIVRAPGSSKEIGRAHV